MLLTTFKAFDAYILWQKLPLGVDLINIAATTQVPLLLRRVDTALSEGSSVVVGLTTTGEAYAEAPNMSRHNHFKPMTQTHELSLQCFCKHLL